MNRSGKNISEQRTQNKVARPPIVFKPNKPSNTQSTNLRTRFAICFLCLFDGLRTPSIRRLVRKPRTLWGKPLLTFDPCFYAPSSLKAVRESYSKSIHCPCDIVVDPSVQTVLTLLRKHGTTIPPQRVLLHYFGHGCYPPKNDSSIFFFSDDRSRYKPLKIANLINACPSAICLILDVPCAGELFKEISKKSDIFAFFSCSQGEQLPLSSDAPMDLFSGCLLDPCKMALWWHMRRHSCVYYREEEARVRDIVKKSEQRQTTPIARSEVKYMEEGNSIDKKEEYSELESMSEKETEFEMERGDEHEIAKESEGKDDIDLKINMNLINREVPTFFSCFLISILESIAFDTQSPGDYEKFSKDPSVFQLLRGYVLAQRIMQSFSINTMSLPQLKKMSNHPLWGFWDTVIDAYLVMKNDAAERAIFDLFVKSFVCFPMTSVFPVFSFLLTDVRFLKRCSDILLEFIDKTDNASSIAARSSIPNTIVKMEKPLPATMIVLAKCVASSTISPFEQNSPTPFLDVRDKQLVKAFMCTLCCTFYNSCVSSFGRLTALCVENAVECAPYSALLLGLLLERASRLMELPPIIEKFSDLMYKKDYDMRASLAYLLGFVRREEAISYLLKLMEDEFPLVRAQAVAGLANLMVDFQDQSSIAAIHEKVNDPDEGVAGTARDYLPYLESLEISGTSQEWPQNNLLLRLLVNSVKSHNFIDRFEGDAFMQTSVI